MPVVGAPRSYEHLVGHRFPAGSFLVSPHRAWLWADCVEAEPSLERAHPSMGWFAAMHGCGASIAGMLELFEPSEAVGPVLGECELELLASLRVGETYTVESRVEAVERKRGGSGVFDRVAIRLDVLDAGGERACSLLNTTIFPRPEAA